MAIWKRKPQEQDGSYQFSGKLYITQGVEVALNKLEILGIYLDIQLAVQANGGVDYLQVYESNEGGRIFFIDQCNPEMMAQEGFNEDFNYCTMLLPKEY